MNILNKSSIPDPQDKITSNLSIGKILDDRILKCEIIDVHETNIHVKILETYWDRMGTYLDVGKTYEERYLSSYFAMGKRYWLAMGFGFLI